MDNREIKNLIKLFDDSNVGELKIKRDEFEIELKKSSSCVETVVAPAPVVASAPISAPIQSSETISNDSGESIKSPMVGTFYAAPSPDAAPFVKVGDTVSRGQSLCIVEAMKIMNEIEAEFDCKIVDILVGDGEPIEFDMPIFKIERV